LGAALKIQDENSGHPSLFTFKEMGVLTFSFLLFLLLLRLTFKPELRTKPNPINPK
jgi:hypothetical protein